MPAFNPFARVSGKYGAPMGRHGHSSDFWDGFGKLYVRHCGGDGFYDRGGAYWGHSRVYAVWTRGGGFCTYVEARGTYEALRIVRQGPMLAGYSVLSAEDARPNGRRDLWIVKRPGGSTFEVEAPDNKFWRVVDAADEDADANPFHPESPEGRAWNSGDRSSVTA